MLNNYLKTALRYLYRYKAYSLINIMGLSVGLAVSLLILLWVQDEKQIDQFHADGERLYRVLSKKPLWPTRLKACRVSRGRGMAILL